jgi:hypothetical protein
LRVSLALAPDLRCSGCDAGVEEHEGDRCAFCRRDERGDDALLSHDDRGWLGPDGDRVPCRCGCGMAEVPGEAPPSETTIDGLIAPLLDTDEAVQVSFRHEPSESARALLKTLGATYTVSPDAPHCVGRCSQCNAIEQGREAAMDDDGREAEPTPEETFIPERRVRRNALGITWTGPMILDAIRAWAAVHGSPPFAWQWAAGSQEHPAKGTVARHFDGWANAIEAAGFPRPKRGRQPEPTPLSKPEPAPAPSANADLRAAGLSLIASLRAFMDALEVELRA